MRRTSSIWDKTNDLKNGPSNISPAWFGGPYKPFSLSLLHRAQRFERLTLCFTDAGHPGDVHAVVGTGRAQGV